MTTKREREIMASLKANRAHCLELWFTAWQRFKSAERVNAYRDMVRQRLLMQVHANQIREFNDILADVSNNGLDSIGID